MLSVVVTGGSGALGRRVGAALVGAAPANRVVSVDVDPLPAPPPAGVEAHVADLAVADLDALLAGADAVVHLAFDHPGGGDEPAAGRNVAATRRLLEAARDARAFVLVSSATAYGAWPNNPVPLTEDAPLRPNPGFAYAEEKAELERLVHEWGRGAPARAVAVLRPVPVVAEGWASWLAGVLEAAGALRNPEPPPAQLLHLDDLTEAVVLAVADRLDGVYNVAPDGWVTGEQLRALAGAFPRLALPPGLESRFGALGRWFGWWRVPDGVEPYVRHPLVVANDRLRAAGWKPTFTTEEAFVVAHAPSPWTEMSPKRRQELALGAAALALGGAAAGVVASLRRRNRGR